MMRSICLLAWAAVLLLPASSFPASVTIVDNGQSRTVICAPADIMADDPKPIPGKRAPQKKSAELEAIQTRQRLRESIKDLAHYLEKMSGAKVAIITEPPKTSDPLLPILIGDFAVKAFGPPKQSAPYKQGFRMVVSPKGIGLMGESDLATSYAIYEVLDRLGCRWFMPSPMGEVIPELKTIRLEEIDFNSAPFTIYRGIWYADEDYRRRNRHGGLLLQAGHALEFYITKEEKQQHPDWVATVGGKPNPSRLKWSKPEVADAIAAKILARHGTNPQPSYSLSPDDGLGYDDSKEDLALDAGDFDPTFQGISITDRLMVVCNRVVPKVTAKHPDLLFGMLAYANYTRPPVREKVHPSIVPQIAPITYSRAHPMTDDRVPGNKELRALIEGWGKSAKMTSMYFYAWFLAEPVAPNPMIAKWSVDVPIVFQNNCKFWQPETMPNFETSMHGLYLGCRLAWDPTQKPADIIQDINARFYGHAAKEMTAYWQFIDDCWTQTPEYSGCGFAYLRRFTPEKMQKARQLLDAGLAACQTPAEKDRVELANESLKLFEAFMKLRRDQAEGRFTNLGTEAEQWRKQVADLGLKYKDQYTFTRVHYRPTTVNGSYFGQFYQQTYTDAARIAREFDIVTSRPIREFRYQIDPEKKGEALGWAKPDWDDKAWKATDVCIDSWSALGHHDYFKSMWYRTDVTIPASPAGKKTYLWIGSTDGSVKVFVNGQAIPYVDAKGVTKEEFNGYCQPASFDISAAIKPGQTIRIALLCTRTFFNELGTGGLLAPVVVYREKP